MDQTTLLFDEEQNLLNALIAAKRTGLTVSKAALDRRHDGGACNFDAPVLAMDGISDATMESLCRQVGLRCAKLHDGSWLIIGCSDGQAGANNAGAEAACKVLVEAGYASYMHYQLD